MNQEINLIKEVPTGKIYNKKEIALATFLGGPLVAGYMIGHNFKIFGFFSKARITYISAIVVTAIIFALIFLTVDLNVNIPKQIVPMIYAVIAYYLTQLLQDKKINEHINSGGATANWWLTIGIGILGAIITAIPLVVLIFIFRL